MNIGVLGLSHRTAPVELREKLAFQSEQLPTALRAIQQELGVAECVILSTCNRVEMYTVLPDRNDLNASHRAKRFLADFHRFDPTAWADPFYWYNQPDSVRHLFRVAAGLESMVVGESEILGQVRDAYSQAVTHGTVGSIFHKLFQTALRTGKEVRSKTRIGQGAISISSVAVELAHRIFQDFKSKTVLTIGAGDMGETTLRCLKQQGVGSILVANRSVETAAPLAQAVGGQVVALSELEWAVTQSDIVIGSTSADHFLLTQPQVRNIMAARRQKPLFLIDISVPRNLDPRIGALENVYLYDIDDLEGIASANRQMRLSEVDNCTAIIEAQMNNLSEKGVLIGQ